MGETFSWKQHPQHTTIIVVTTALGAKPPPDHDVQSEIMEFHRWVHQTYPKRAFSLLTVMRSLDIVLGDSEEQMLAHSTMGMAQMFEVERGAYVIDSATMRLQFSRVFRENGLGDRLRTFERENEAVAFLTSATR